MDKKNIIPAGTIVKTKRFVISSPFLLYKTKQDSITILPAIPEKNLSEIYGVVEIEPYIIYPLKKEDFIPDIHSFYIDLSTDEIFLPDVKENKINKKILLGVKDGLFT